jgi:hypothetical protein
MSNKIFFIEDFEDTNTINKIITENNPIVFSLNYATHIILDKNDIPHQIGESYLTETDEKEIDNTTINTTLHWHENELLKKTFVFDDINLANSLEMEFIQYFTKIYLTIFSVMRIIEKEKPVEVFAATAVNDFIRRVCESRGIKITLLDQTADSALILDRLNIKFDVLSIPISFHVSRNKFMKIKKFTEIVIDRLFSLQPISNSNKNSILLLDFNVLQYQELIKELSALDKNILLLNQRRPAIWNLQSFKIIRDSKCKIIHLQQFEKNVRQKITDEASSFANSLAKIWSMDSVFEKIFSINSYTFWHSIKNSFISTCNSRFKESIHRILVLHELFKTLKISVILEWAETAQEEKEVISIAKKYGIKSVLLQHSLYPTTKVLEPFGRFLSYFSYPAISDKQAIWGQIMKKYALTHGYNEENLLVVGSPRHDHFVNYQSNTSKSQGIILLATSGATGIAAKYSTTLARINYDKFTKEVIRILKTFSDKKLVVKIAPHQEHVGIANVIDLIKEIDPNIPVMITANLTELITSCDVLITFNNSTIALESLLMGKPTASIQTEEWLQDEEISKMGAILSVSKMSELEPQLRKLVYDEEFKKQLQTNAKIFLQKYIENLGSSSKALSVELDKLSN